MMITSSKNQKVQWVRSLLSQPRQRREEGLFVLEGVRLVEEALHSEWGVRLLLYTSTLDSRGRQVVTQFINQGCEVEEVSLQVMRSVSDTENPQGLLAVIALKETSLPENPTLIFIPDNIRDPGNLGTMLRSAAAAGADAVFLPEGTVDPYSPKVLRAAMGAHFLTPIKEVTWEYAREVIEQSGMQVFLAETETGTSYLATDFRPPLALIIGNEAQGASPQGRSLASQRIHIPMPGKVESLNAAAAAAIILFEIVRQRLTS